MAKLHEHQGKSILQMEKIAVPHGGSVDSVEEAKNLADTLSGPVVVKGQAWTTGRADLGLIRFADTPDEAYQAAGAILGQRVEGFQIERVLVEEKLSIEREFYAGIIIDGGSQTPVVIFSSVGGTGIEEIAFKQPDAVARLEIDIQEGLPEHKARDLVRRTGIHGKLQMQLGSLLARLYRVAKKYDARAAEINPIVLTEDGKIIAADCRITIDDYAIFRHPELGIEVAREFDRPPTELERIAWQVEKDDYRGTFYFIQMELDFERGDGVIGFHGAGGGGSMMSMDAVLNHGYKIANFVDTSGNPPASKVYRAARIILAQGPVDGYFASGSGVASQEQFHSARGLVKAFMEAPLNIPAVIRLGGNAEDQAIAIMERAREEIPAPLEAYGKDDSPDFCAGRLDALIKAHTKLDDVQATIRFPQATDPYTFSTVTDGQVQLDHAKCRTCESKVCIDTCVPGILHLQNDVPVLNITIEEAQKGGCIECLACQIECYFGGNQGGFVKLPIPGLED
ncbi:MAG: ATP-grasp domain-containing protein [Anaerolineales bacterium]